MEGLVLEGLGCASCVTQTLNEVLKRFPGSGLPSSIENTLIVSRIATNIISGRLSSERKPELMLHLSAGEPPADAYEAALKVANGNLD